MKDLLCTTATPKDALLWNELGDADQQRVNTILSVLNEAAKARARGESSHKVMEDFCNNHRGPGIPGIKQFERFWKQIVIEGKNWTMALEKRRNPIARDVGLPLATREFFATLCENNQRKTAPAYREFMRRLFNTDASGEKIPGIGTWRDLFRKEFDAEPPAERPLRWTPAGFTLANFRNYAPKKHELVLMRRGKKAASSLRPVTCYTRVGMEPFEVVMCDDVWADVKVNFVGGKPDAAFRPVWLDALDLASGSVFAHMVLRVTRDDDGAKQMIKMKHARWFLCSMLAAHGIRRAGMTFVIERATMAWSEDVDAALNLAARAAGCGEIAVCRGKIDAEPVIAGMFRSTGGNPHMKAALESMRNLLHNELAALPGQTGKDRDSKPEGSYGRDIYNGQLIAAIAEIYGGNEKRKIAPNPALAKIVWKLVKLPFIGFDEFCDLLAEVYCRINARTEHKLEGWKAAKNYQLRYIPREGDDGEPMDNILALPPDQNAGILALVNANPGKFLREVPMSPAEVFARKKPAMAKFPWHFFPQILGTDPAVCVERKLDENYTFSFADEELGYGEHIYPGKLYTPTGMRDMLAAGQTYATWIIPGLGDGRQMMIVGKPGDKKGSCLGYVLKSDRPAWTDHTARAKQAAEMMQIADELASNAQQRHAGEGLAQELTRAANEAILETAQKMLGQGNAPAAKTPAKPQDTGTSTTNWNAPIV